MGETEKEIRKFDFLYGNGTEMIIIKASRSGRGLCVHSLLRGNRSETRRSLGSC